MTNNQDQIPIRWELDSHIAHHLQLLALQDLKVTLLFFPDTEDYRREPDFHCVRVRSLATEKSTTHENEATDAIQTLDHTSLEDCFLFSVRMNGISEEISVPLDTKSARNFLAGNAFLVYEDHTTSWDLFGFASETTLPEDTQLAIMSRRFPDYDICSPNSTFPSWNFYRRNIRSSLNASKK
jgi:hypothetical protein